MQPYRDTDAIDTRRSHTNHSFRLKFLLAVGALAGIAATVGYFAATNTTSAVSTKLAATAVATTATVASPLFAALVFLTTVVLLAAALSSRRTVHVGPAAVVQRHSYWPSYYNDGLYTRRHAYAPTFPLPVAHTTHHGRRAATHSAPITSTTHHHGMFAPASNHHGHGGVMAAAPSAPTAFDAPATHGHTHSRR